MSQDKDAIALALEAISEIDSLINEPPENENLLEVREYRHSIYRKWEAASMKITEALSSIKDQQAHGEMQKPASKSEVIAWGIFTHKGKALVLSGNEPSEELKRGAETANMLVLPLTHYTTEHPTAGAAQELLVANADGFELPIQRRYDGKFEFSKYPDGSPYVIYTSPQPAPSNLQEQLIAELEATVTRMQTASDKAQALIAKQIQQIITLELQSPAPVSKPEVWWDRGAGSFYLNREHIPPHIPADRITAMCRCDAPVQKEGELK